MIGEIELGALPKGLRYYEGDGGPRCPYRCVVGGIVCICEFVAGHEQGHERVGTMQLAGVNEFSTLDVFKDFGQREPIAK
jgi:hypothetical protein